MQCLLVSLRRSAISCFIFAANWGGMPGMFMSSTLIFDCHKPGWTIASLVITPDWPTAFETWLVSALWRSISGPLLHAASARTDAATQTAYFIIKAPFD